MCLAARGFISFHSKSKALSFTIYEVNDFTSSKARYFAEGDKNTAEPENNRHLKAKPE